MDDSYYSLKKKIRNSAEPMTTTDLNNYRILKLHFQRAQGNAQDLCFVVFAILFAIQCFCLYIIAVKPS